MRNNQPINSNEFVISDTMTLVSKTDLTGNILECNDAFELASGFSRQELIGQPHNIIRHPDVPEAVFADMWATLKKGAPWTQIVKNRRADGGYYWVKANATPLFDNKNIIGYMSIRSKATASEVEAASQAYKDITNGRAKIKNGRIVYGLDLLPLFHFYKRINPQYQLTMMVGLLYLIPYLIYATIQGHHLGEMVTVAILGLLPPYLLGLSQLKCDRRNRLTLREIASGKKMHDEWFDPLTFHGKMLSAIKSTALAAQERIEESQYQLDNAKRLQTAMDKINANVMIADTKYDIIYMNNAMHDFFNQREKQLKKALPNLDAKKILGANIDIFHQNPEHNRSMLANIKEPTVAQIVVADYHLNLNIIPVYNRNGLQTATVVEWQDKTSDVQLLEEVGGAINAAKSGLLDRRIDLKKTEGVAKQLSESINELIASVEKPINEVVMVAVALSEGNLTHHVKGEYLGRFAVVKDSLNVAVDNLESMMSQTKLAVTHVSDSASQIHQGSIDLNDRTQTQAASIEQTASSMEQITAAVKQTADNAQQASQVTHSSADLAKSGVSVMDNAILAMEQIHQSSQKINDIISLIDSIAFQTNLLALNAAVEAARAGEHGKGFAVVAGEVRTLAQKSADAAKDIRQLIEDTVKKVSEGTIHVKESGESLNGIVESINNVNMIIEEIANSSGEQSQGVNLVNDAISQIDSAVQQNAALVEETAATSEELGSMSNMMTQNIAHFTIKNTKTNLDIASSATGFDFAQTRRSHRQWRVKVRAYINDIDVDFDRKTARDGTLCALGQWLYGQGKQFQAFSSYQALERAHAELHQFIGRIMDLKDIGDIDTANIEMSKLETESSKVIELIRQLEKEIGNNIAGNLIAQKTKLPQQQKVEHSSHALPTPQSQPKAETHGDGDSWSEF
ncbi:MAG: methyl-accepting chemotaxis protein [Thiomicrorhabdus sp.]|nr:methyl-accepting chemotaxis protein [Thiomicrorhabdus sp.]